jgi:hypothetical protein
MVRVLRLSTVLLLLWSGSQPLHAQTAVQFQIPITVSNGGTSKVLRLGVSGDGPGGVIPDNTIGVDFDASFGAYQEVVAPPPPPPPFELDARFLTIPGRVSTFPIGLGGGVITDYRGFETALQVDSFRISLSGEGITAGPTTISWPSDLGLYGTTWTIRPQSGSEWTPVDMLTQPSVLIPAGVLQRNVLIIKTGATQPVPVPGFLLTPRSVDFGNVVVGVPAYDTVTVSNPGTLPVILSGLGSSDTLFRVDTPVPDTIAPSAVRRVPVTFTPDTLGDHAAVVLLFHSAAGSPDTLMLQGRGVAAGPVFRVTPASGIHLGAVLLGGSRSDSLTVENSGIQPLSVSSVSSSSPAFAVVPRGAFGISPGGRRTFFVTFTPAAPGLVAADLVFSHNAVTSPDTVRVAGEGLVPEPAFALEPDSLDFGSVARGDSLTDSVKVTNVGTLPLIVTSALSDNPDFRVDPAASDSILPDGSRRFLLTFAPTAYGTQTGRLILTHNASGSPDTVHLQGLAPEPLFTIAPATAPLGNVILGDTGTVILTVRNPGAAPLVITLAASSHPEFSVAPAAATVAPADSQAFAVRFFPQDLGPESAVIVFTHNADSSPDSVPASGTGVQPGFALSPQTLLFDSIGVTRTLRDTATVSNPGTAPLFVEAYSDNASFTVTPAGPLFILPGTERAFTIAFRPIAPGALTGNIIFLHNAPGSPDSLTVSGTGIPLFFLSLPPETIAAKDPVRGRFLKAVKRGRALYPNWANLIEETVAQGGFQPGSSESDSAGGLRIGLSFMERRSPDPLKPRWSPRKAEAGLYCWVRLSSWDFKKSLGKSASKIVKTLENKTFRHVTALSPPRGLDSTGAPGDLKRKKLLKQVTKLDPKKTANRLYAELIALKVAIAASQLGKTPQGFGELVYDVDGSPLDELSLVDISRRADSLMTFWRAIPANQITYDSLLSVISRVNRAFAGRLDTVTFERTGRLMLAGQVALTAVPWLRAGDAPLRILTPTTTETETEEEFGEEGWEIDGETPLASDLLQNFPNPFNPVTTLGFRLVEPAVVNLTVYDLLGRGVARVLVSEDLDAGLHTVEFDGTALASGVYLARMDAAAESGIRTVQTMKMLLLK